MLTIIVARNKKTGKEHRFGEPAWEKLKETNVYDFVTKEQIGENQNERFAYTGVAVQSTGGCNC